MAVANTKSKIVSDADSTPPKQTKAQIFQGRKRTLKATVAVLAGDDNNSVYRLSRVASHWQIESIVIFQDVITGGTDWDLGIYDIAENNAGAVVDINAYADAIDLSAVNLLGTERAFATRPIENVDQAVWQDVGLSADPGKWYDLCLTGVAVGSVAADITAIITYTDGS